MGSLGDAPYRTAEGTLGELVRVHTDRSGCALNVVFGLLAGCIVAFAVLRGIPAWIAATMVAVIVGGVLFLRRVSRRGPRVRIELHRGGLLSRSSDGDRALRFEDVRSVTSSTRRRGISGVSLERHVVEGKDGTRIEFTLMVDDAPGLLAAVHEATRQRLRDEATRAYNEGEVVRFGPLSVSQDGVKDGARLVPWKDVARVSIANRALAGTYRSTVEVFERGRSGPFASHGTEDVPNAELFVELVELAVQVELEDAAPQEAEGEPA